MGLPGSGKSTLKKKLFDVVDRVRDPEAFMRDYKREKRRSRTRGQLRSFDGAAKPQQHTAEMNAKSGLPDTSSLAGYRFIDVEPDSIKKSHPHYYDKSEEGDSRVHSWSVRNSAWVSEEIAAAARDNFILDASGSNPDWLLDRVEVAEKHGYKVSVVFVDTPVEICLFRNRQR